MWRRTTPPPQARSRLSVAGGGDAAAPWSRRVSRLPRALQAVALALVELPADVLHQWLGQVEEVGEVRVDRRLHDEVRRGDRIPVRDGGARHDRVGGVDLRESLGGCARAPGEVEAEGRGHSVGEL